MLGQLNEALLRSGDGRFCTVLYLGIRPRRAGGAAEVTVASGGHPLPLRVTADDIGEVGEPGTLVGVLEAPSLPETTVQIRPGDVLLGCTDGLTEGRRDGEFYGEERLLDLIGAHRDLACGDLVAVLLEDVLAYQDGMPATTWRRWPSVPSVTVDQRPGPTYRSRHVHPRPPLIV